MYKDKFGEDIVQQIGPHLTNRCKCGLRGESFVVQVHVPCGSGMSPTFPYVRGFTFLTEAVLVIGIKDSGRQ